ncbi:NADP-dependent 3-hydroxy acid dehydrogenase YdfG [Stella humosa]|uniref:NADP-dependent 3-hydroxy acid dehydrogenase YdfG n=1 Tax=Stella humosa TaxID=94 RepID=A0A3N1M9N0_9PROT|nr:SDR family oxidoreductase [Stella humosa]ROQ00348.1 NADP-dependent 3-hydroxy acid dehydrogenase YdfG [Stella humosa]BBK30413.1 putative oxidoreductase [Stella humosa]
MELKGKVAIITGASSGLGLACAEALAGEGVRLVLGGRRVDRLEDFARRFPGTRAVSGDITEPAAIAALFAEAETAFGQVDIVFNNAGYMTSGTIEQIDIDRVAAMVRLNVEAAYRVMYTAMKHFRRVGSGHLVNTSSILGLKVGLESGAYAGTKYAIEALAEALRMEVARSDIRITNLQPGLIATELHREYEVSIAKQRSIDHPLQPADVAQALLFALKQPPHVRVPAILISPGESAL